ncbi:MAG TPA: protein kinase [Pyrinomonadaceae bacterium]
MKYCTLCKAKYEDTVTFCTVDGEVLEEDQASLVDTVLDGQYHIESMLGKGGMGAVYRARHILLGDRVAIKVLPPQVRNNAEWLRRFRREGQAARRFRHPNSVTVHDLRTTPDGTTYMVMEYVQGQTLDAELKRRKRFTAQEAFEILTPIMSVLETAHSMGVVHRDLKPENIMVSLPEDKGPPVVKLLDLGIAKMREIAGSETSNTALTMAGQVLGTPYYMSPEQWGEIPRDQNVEIDGRADIYSLGLVFYELLAGRRCYSGKTLHELRREHVSTAPRPLSEVVPDVPKDFSAAITKAISKDRADRQGTAKELEAELRAALESAESRTVLRHKGDLNVDTLAGTTVDTQSSVDTPTIITLDAVAEQKARETASGRSDATVIEHAPDKSEIAPTIVERGSLPSSITIPQVPTQTISVPQPVEKKKSKAPLAVAAVIVLFVIVGAGIGGVVLYSKWKAPAANPIVTITTPNPPATTAQPVGSYWLELEQPHGSARVPGTVALASGQTMKLHFMFTEDGYVYLIGPGGDTNQPTAFLTSKPPEGSGLTTNRVNGNTDFSFPSGSNWLSLDRNPGTDTFKVIFSKTPLTSPAFLDQSVTLQPLTAAQREELNQFEAKYKNSKTAVELDESNKQAPAMRIKLPPDQLNNPIVFDIRIQHK